MAKKATHTGLNESYTETVDFSDIDDLFCRQDGVPQGGITASMLATRYRVSEATARTRMRDLSKKGYVLKQAKVGAYIVRYVIKEK